MNKGPEKTVAISFEYAFEADPSPMTTIHNALILIPSLSDQINRYGLHRTSIGSSTMTGRLQGGRDSFVAMINSYGFRVEIS